MRQYLSGCWQIAPFRIDSYDTAKGAIAENPHTLMLSDIGTITARYMTTEKTG
jgi:hypothetical protein